MVRCRLVEGRSRVYPGMHFPTEYVLGGWNPSWRRYQVGGYVLCLISLKIGSRISDMVSKFLAPTNGSRTSSPFAST